MQPTGKYGEAAHQAVVLMDTGNTEGLLALSLSTI